MFSMLEVEKFTLKELKQLAMWYDIKYAKNIKKEALLELLTKELYAEPEENEDEDMSARVKLLRRLNQ